MSTVSDKNDSNTHTAITDIENQPVTVDSNPAHFDGLLGEIASFVERSGMYQELLEQGITFRGAKTVIESPAVIPFLPGLVANPKVYSAVDPCPPTAKRLTDHNDSVTRAGASAITPLTKIPGDDPNYIVNKFFIKQDDLALGNAVATCFEDADYVNRMRAAYGMGARDMITRLKFLGERATPAQRTLVFCAVSPVLC